MKLLSLFHRKEVNKLLKQTSFKQGWGTMKKRAELLAEKYSEQVAKTFSKESIDLLERACNLLKPTQNKLACLAKAEKAISSGKKRVHVCIVDRCDNSLVLVESYLVHSTFEAKDIMSALHADFLKYNSNLFVMKY